MKIIARVFFVLTLLLGGLSLSSCEEFGFMQGAEGNETEEPNTPIVKGLVLYASSSVIVANGQEELVVTVELDGVDVTDLASLYVNNTPMSGNIFTTQKTGDYKFYASYKGKISNQVTVKAANPALYVALPEDSQPENFNGFDRKVLVAEGTGTWCGYCPYMIAALELFSENGSNADKAVIVATHSGDEFSCTASEAVVAAMNIKSFPSCVLNFNPEIFVENNYPEVNAENINAMVGMELKESARVGVAAATAMSADSTIVGVRAAVKVGKDGSYRVNAWLIEDGVAAYQYGASVINHMHILRDASCVSPIQGQLLGGKETCSEGDVVEFYYEFDINKANVANVRNCKIAVLVTASTGTSTRFFTNNIIECHVGESVPFAYN